MLMLTQSPVLEWWCFGVQCAITAGELMSPGGKLPPLPTGACDESIANLDALRAGKGTEPTADIRKEMQKVMQNCAAVYRTGESLKECVQLIDQCATKMPNVKVRQRKRAFPPHPLAESQWLSMCRVWSSGCA